jgi:hypothetical protein
MTPPRCAALLSIASGLGTCGKRARYHAVNWSNRSSVPIQTIAICGTHARRYMRLGWDIEDLPV